MRDTGDQDDFFRRNFRLWWKVCIIKKVASGSLNLAKAIAKFSSDKKAEDILVLDMREVVNFCDYFVISSGSSDRHVKAIADGIEEGLRDLGIKIKPREGLKRCDWVILDAGDVVVHTFVNDLREFYGLEYLWQEAKKIKWETKLKKK